MLIRSQDKKTLVNLESTNAISIYESNTGFTVDAGGANIDYKLGEYSTEEKAVKVLDKLEETYAGTLWTEGESIIANRVVFLMPQDEAVESSSKKTNFDRIRSMSIEELAMNMMCPNENGLGEIECNKDDNCDCYKCILEWLQKDVK